MIHTNTNSESQATEIRGFACGGCGEAVALYGRAERHDAIVYGKPCRGPLRPIAPSDGIEAAERLLAVEREREAQAAKFAGWVAPDGTDYARELRESLRTVATLEAARDFLAA